VKHRQATLHIVEFTGIDHVFRFCFEDLVDFRLRGLDAGVGRRMAGENLGQGAGLLLLERLDLFEEIDERGGVVAGLVQILQAQVIGLRFHGLGEVQEAQGDGEAGALTNGIAGPSAHENQGDGGIVDELPLGLLLGAVAGGDVGDFVGHDAGEFGFGIGFQDQTGVAEEESAPSLATADENEEEEKPAPIKNKKILDLRPKIPSTLKLDFFCQARTVALV